MNLSQQKLEIDNRRAELQIFVNELQSKIKVLERGMKQIDAGEDMFEGKSILSQEVRKIMQMRLIDLI